MKRKIQEERREEDGSESSELRNTSDDRSRSGMDSLTSERSSSSGAGAGSGDVAAVGIVTSPTFSSLFSVTPTFSSSGMSAASLQREKKACRRHRRKLARIVTEQWKYAARSRILALKVSRVWEACARRNAFLHWKDTAKSNAEIARNIDLSFPVFVSGRCFKNWKKFTQLSKELRACRLHLTQTLSARKTRNTILLWRDRVDTRLLHDKKMCTAIHYHMISSMSRFFSDWKMARQENQKKLFHKKVAYAKWTFSRQRLALQAWKCFLEMKHAKAMIGEAWRLKTLSSCFRFWCSRRKALPDSESETSVDYLLQDDMLLLVVDSHFKRKKQRQTFGAWSELIRCRSSIKLIVSGFYRDKVLFNVLRKAYQSWMDHHFYVRLKHSQRIKAARYRTSYKLQSCVRWWLQYKSSKAFKHRRRYLALKRWESGITRKALFQWIDYCYQNKSRKEMQELVSRQWKLSRLKVSFHWWMDFISALRRKRMMVDRAENGRADLIARRGFSAWLDFVQTRKRRKTDLQQQFDELIELLNSSRLANAWKQWRRFLRYRKSKSSMYEKAELFCRTQGGQRVFRAWHRLRESSKSHHQAGDFYTKLLQRLALLGWFQVRQSKCPVKEPQRIQPEERVAKMPVSFPSKEITTASLEQLEKLGNDCRAGALGRMRPAPRRTLLPISDVRHILPSQSPAFDVASFSNQSGNRDFLAAFSLPTKPDADADLYQSLQKRVNGDVFTGTTATATPTLDFPSSLDSPDTEYSHVIADEVAWMDHLLSGFEDLKAELVEKRAELALVLETNASGSRDKAQFLSQKISLLQQRRAILLPTIQAVASVVPGLRLRARKVIYSSESSNGGLPNSSASFRR